MKVFISHASADKPTVRKIKQALEEKEIEVWVDEAVIRVGESIPEAVTSGLTESDLLLLAFSQQALQSPWVKRELHAFFMTALKNEKPIVPCRLDASDPPTLLADIKYADFRDDFNVGMTALLGAVGIAEEISDARTAAELAESVGGRLSAEERRRCYDTFIKSGFVSRGKVVPITQVGTLEMFPLSDVKDLLQKSGLIKCDKIRSLSKDTMPFKYIYEATPMGRRVFILWEAEADGHT